jgi:penicillin-binding protein 1A
MALGRKQRARREPTLIEPVAKLDLRLTSRDRAGGDRNESEPAFRNAGGDAKQLPRKKSPSERGRGQASKKKAGRKATRGGGGSKRRASLGRVLYWACVLALWAVIGVIASIVWVGAHLPSISSLEVPKRPPSIKIVALDGSVLATRGDSGVSVTLRELPAHVPQAFIAIEDRRFYSHRGVDPLSVGRALLANALHRGVTQGGSTITQQLAKNLFLTQERTLTRKLQEAMLALWLERKFSKTEILELYLNRVYFGAGAYGVEAAAQRYFGKSARQASLAEAAMLAGLVKSPSRLAPTRNPHGAEQRAQAVIAAMAEMGFASDSKAKLALAQPAHALKQNTTGSVNYVADWIMDVLDDLVGLVESDLAVTTSIDPVLQAAAENALNDELARNGDKFGVSQGAIVAMSPDGAVRALVGGRNYAESQFNRAVAAKRQPGSAFKPFVYLTAIERGLTPDSVREDRPIALKGWKPENYNHQYFGPVTLTQALAHSLNTVAVRLTLEFGPNAVIRTAHRLGIASKLEANPSIALGTSEVSLIELVSAIVPFANGGMASAPHVVEEVRAKDGTILYRREAKELGRVVEPRYVAMMNAMMQETLLTGTARAAQLPGWPAAGKTGTSQDFRDAWFVGYTAHLVTGVWLGNDDSSATRKASGAGLPVEIWSRVMRSGHRGIAVASLPGFSSGGIFPLPASFSSAPSAPARSSSASGASVGLDNWLLDKLFGRR